MVVRAPRITSVKVDEDPILAAIRRAPGVPFTAEERALIAEVQSDPSTWQSTEALMAKLAMLAPGDGEDAG